MRKVEKMEVKYSGYANPQNEDELEMEILGLEIAIAVASQRISVLRQSLKMVEMAKGSVVEESVEKNIEKGDEDAE